MPPLEGVKEVKQGKELKNFTLNKLLASLPVMLVQIKAGNNSYKLKNKIRQIFCIIIRKASKKFCKNLIK